MRIPRILPVLFLPVFLGACGGGDQAEPAADAEMATVASAPACVLQGATMAEALERPSPIREVSFSVGGHDGLLCYGAPSARGRVILGEIEPFGTPWRMGANEPTTLHLTGPTQVGGVTLEAGSYSLYAIPGETEWTIFLNSNVDRWGIPIGDDVRATEVGSFTAPVEATDAPVETLTFSFVPSEDGAMGDFVVEWESARVKFPVQPVMP
ncbi:MAG TPA: DUF2911 domain-containing protein [Longimicrobiales bacterium]|nr:DUF2911 domain-containing protein [Longimicrobiales bacterium]